AGRLILMRRNNRSLLNSRRDNLMADAQEFTATGRRKTSVARVGMSLGSGKIDINVRSFEDYFPTASLQNLMLQPLQIAKLVHAYHLWINTRGGGTAGQAGAVRL